MHPARPGGTHLSPEHCLRAASNDVARLSQKPKQTNTAASMCPGHAHSVPRGGSVTAVTAATPCDVSWSLRGRQAYGGRARDPCGCRTRQPTSAPAGTVAVWTLPGAGAAACPAEAPALRRCRHWLGAPREPRRTPESLPVILSGAGHCSRARGGAGRSPRRQQSLPGHPE